MSRSAHRGHQLPPLAVLTVRGVVFVSAWSCSHRALHPLVVPPDPGQSFLSHGNSFKCLTTILASPEHPFFQAKHFLVFHSLPLRCSSSQERSLEWVPFGQGFMAVWLVRSQSPPSLFPLLRMESLQIKIKAAQNCRKTDTCGLGFCLVFNTPLV